MAKKKKRKACGVTLKELLRRQSQSDNSRGVSIIGDCKFTPVKGHNAYKLESVE